MGSRVVRSVFDLRYERVVNSTSPPFPLTANVGGDEFTTRTVAARSGTDDTQPRAGGPGWECGRDGPTADPPPSVYSMRMARVNITVPDDLLVRAKAAGLNVSRLAAAALDAELERRVKVAELDAYLADLDAELGPIPQQESLAAREWADQVLPRSGDADAARGARPA